MPGDEHQPRRSRQDAAPAFFRAVLHPHRSLGHRGFLVLMAAFGGVSFATGLLFWSLGAWPVLGFCGLDVLLLWLAFRLNYRAGRRFEVVELAPGELRLIRVEPGGATEQHAFNAYWVRCLLEEQAGRPAVLKLASHGRELIFGGFLTDDEKRDFAQSLRAELSAARSSVP